ncbi:hypothetical protein WS83_25165 [Burkholderia sp. MSMB2042]|nr:hypothetical protein WS78_29030 [Burkholderia savannae]AOJ84742.1 hypothetical protein WS86_30020 [Burkholderia savannae]KVG45045.1 hypothetical protein WS77_07720 [Burkholderia sp. MSMB0265]KVG96172.1 hypothetical protein WS82_03130 [Burkholderia sp. MSMB2041]KVG99802.1 hypothetical protein WS83_25165 [Burkholderia sp. MSMB2042]
MPAFGRSIWSDIASRRSLETNYLRPPGLIAMCRRNKQRSRRFSMLGHPASAYTAVSSPCTGASATLMS